MQYSFVTMGQKDSKTNEDNSYLHVVKYFHMNMEWTLALESYNKLLAFLANKILQTKNSHDSRIYNQKIDDCSQIIKIMEDKLNSPSLPHCQKPMNSKVEITSIAPDTAPPQSSQNYMRIEYGDIGNSYANLFSRYMDDSVKKVVIIDAYIQRSQQITLFFSVL